MMIYNLERLILIDEAFSLG